MLIAEDIFGQWLGLCRYANIDIGLAVPCRGASVCSTRIIDTGRRDRKSYGTPVRICSLWATGTSTIFAATANSFWLLLFSIRTDGNQV